MLTPHIFIGLFLIIIGFLVSRYPNLIAGYNSLSKEEKEKVDIDRLSNRMKITFIIMGILVATTSPILYYLELGEYEIHAIITIILMGTFSLFIRRIK